MTAIASPSIKKALMPVPAITVSGTFYQSPFHGRLCIAEMSMLPLHTPEEFRHVWDFELPSDLPVIFSPRQRYNFLEELVDGIKSAVPSLKLALVRLGAPDYRTQLPRRLLQSDVLLMHDPWLFVPALDLSDDGCAVVIWQELRSDSVEPGNNSLSVTLLGDECGASFIEYMERTPLLERMAERAVLRATYP